MLSAALGTRFLSSRPLNQQAPTRSRCPMNSGEGTIPPIRSKYIYNVMPPEIPIATPPNLSGPRQRPRQARTYQRRVEIQPRDIELFCLLAHDVRLVTVPDIYAAFGRDFHSLHVLRRRAKEL